MGADRRQAHGDGRGDRRRLERPGPGRPAAVAQDQSRGGVVAAASRSGHQQRAEQRVRAAPDLDRSIPSATSTRSCSRSIPTTSAIPTNLDRIFVAGAGDAQVPLSAVVRYERALSPLSIFHSGQFPSSTVSFGLDPDVTLQQATQNIQRAVDELHMPRGHSRRLRGQCRRFRHDARGASRCLILGALVAVYIVLGVLYESLAHPFTIISTLPSAGPRRAAGAADLQHAADRDRVHRHHPADRHRQEERHHDRRLRAGGRTPARPVAGRVDFRGEHRALPADPDDDAGGAAGRRTARRRNRSRHRAAPAARHHHHRRLDRVAGADALHHAGDLSC